MNKKQLANSILQGLDDTASNLERLVTSGRLNTQASTRLKAMIHNLDGFADKFQVFAFGEKSLKSLQAKVIKQDADEPYMKTFENTVEPLQTDSDETFMHKVDSSFNSDAIETFDADMSSSVTNRKEHDVRDLSEHADKTKPQPSWTGGKGGKSTRQGGERPTARQATPEKTWAS